MQHKSREYVGEDEQQSVRDKTSTNLAKSKSPTPLPTQSDVGTDQLRVDEHPQQHSGDRETTTTSNPNYHHRDSTLYESEKDQKLSPQAQCPIWGGADDESCHHRRSGLEGENRCRRTPGLTAPQAEQLLTKRYHGER